MLAEVNGRPIFDSTLSKYRIGREGHRYMLTISDLDIINEGMAVPKSQPSATSALNRHLRLFQLKSNASSQLELATSL
jgi:hypothetical protein